MAKTRVPGPTALVRAAVEPARCVVSRHPAVAWSIERRPAKQLAYRLRHQRLASADPVVLRSQLQRQRLLVAHTVYGSARCDERYLGVRRCSSGQVYCRALGPGGQCEDCDHIMLLTELLGTWGDTS